MKPIRDIADVQPSNVLYHSAFGFARVEHIADGHVDVSWERKGPNLPASVSPENLRRVYTLCTPGGFFERAFNEPDAVRELLQVDPPEGIALLLGELPGPQARQDLQDWVTGRNLMSERAFSRWWEDLVAQVEEDGRFIVDQDTICLIPDKQGQGPLDQLENSHLSPSRRLDVALAHRQTLQEEGFRRQAILAMRTGGRQVRDLAMAALREHHPDEVLRAILGPGPDNVDALIHAIRRGGWDPEQISPDVHAAVLERIRRASEEGGPMDAEGRLTAAVTRWGVPGAVRALAEMADTANGQRLLYATFAALPPRRAQDLALDMLDEVVDRKPKGDGAQWLGTALLMQSGADHVTLAEQLAPTRLRVSRWLDRHYTPYDRLKHDLDTAEAQTIEIELEPLEASPVLLSDLPPRPGATLIDLGISLARALSSHHNNGRVVNPSRWNVTLRGDGTVEIPPVGAPEDAPRPVAEAPSQASDLHAAGVLLIESLIGRTWPRNIPADRVLPYLRHLAPDLPPSALGPLDAVLHPERSKRPADGLAWLTAWQRAAEAEETRAKTSLDEGITLNVGYDTHVGRMKILHTQTNQDALYAAVKGPVALFVVCDGISTANAGSGDVASGITAHVVASLWEQALARLGEAQDEGRRDFLNRALRMANRAVCEAALRFAGGNLDGRVPMGTTAVAAITRGNHVSLTWLGDSRAYLVGKYGASLLTADQNQAGERLRAWHRGLEPTWEPGGFALIGYVGHFSESARPEALIPSHLPLTLLRGERLVLCSDGITDYIGESHPEVAARLAARAREGTPDEAARGLVELANRGGGGDNATVIVVEATT